MRLCTQRLKAIVAAADTVVTATGQAVVSESTTQRRTIVGRVLVQAGYEVKFALDKQAAEVYCSESETRIAVHSAQMGDPRKLIDAVALAGALPIWIITTEASSVSRLARSLAGLDRVAVTSNAGSPEDLLFLANELVFARGSKRREWRALYGTPVAFRAEGTFRDEYGFSYDVSPTGVYVRSLLPCEADSVEVELRPPRSEERLRLHGKVVRRFAFGSGSVASAPPGFAVKWIGPASALAAWENACRELIHVAGVGSPPSLRPGVPQRAESQLAIPAPSVRIEAPEALPPNSDVGALLADALGDEALPEAGRRPVTVELGAERESMIPGLESEPPATLPPEAVTTRTDPAPPPDESEREPLPLPVPEIRGAPPPVPARKGPPGPPPRTFAKTLVGVAVPVPVPPSTAASAAKAPAAPPPRPASRSGAIALSPPLASARETPRTPQAAPVEATPVRRAPEPATDAVPAAPAHASPTPPEALVEAPDDEPTVAVNSSATAAQPPAPAYAEPPSDLDAVLELESPQGERDVIPDPFSPEPPNVTVGERAPLAFARTMLAGDDDEPTVARPPAHEATPPAAAPMPSRVAVRDAPAPPFEVVPNVPRVPVEFSEAPAARLDDDDEPIAGLPARRGSGARVVGVIASGVVFAAAAAVGVLALRGGPTTPPSEPARVEPKAAVAPPAETPAPSSTPAAAPAPLPPATAVPAADTAGAAPAASEAPAPSAATSDVAPATSAAPPVVPGAPPPPDVSTLPGDRGFLLVRSSASARVFVHGKDVGETNSYLQTSCGIRFVRLGRAFADFIEPGRSVVLKCGQVNELAIEPLP